MTDEAQQTAADDVAVAQDAPDQKPEADAAPVETPAQEPSQEPVATVEPTALSADEGEDEELDAALDELEAEAQIAAEDEWPAYEEPVQDYHQLSNPNALRGVPAGPPPHPRSV